MKKNIFKIVIITAVIIFAVSGCAEPRYYHEHHQHSPRYYHNHHREPPVGIDLNIHN
jgi:hypothetical protein